jgi:NADH dehydrogenase
LLYQVATGWLSPANIASTLRTVLRAQKNARVLLAEATDIDVNNRHVILSTDNIPYDSLIVATGSRHHYFGNEQWESLAPGLKTIEDAIEIRRRIFLAFEAAEREGSSERGRGHLTFIIVGGGPTGVELAGALADIVNDTLTNDFRRINRPDVQILLVEVADRILTTYPLELSKKAESFLNQEEISVKASSTVGD